MAVLGNTRRVYIVTGTTTLTYTWLTGEQTNNFNRTSEALEYSDKSTVWAQVLAGKRGATAEVTVYVDDTNTFENGDVILTVNGQKITCIADNDAILEELNNGDILTVVVARLTAVTSGRRVSYSIEEVTVEIRVIEMYR